VPRHYERLEGICVFPRRTRTLLPGSWFGAKTYRMRMEEDSPLAMATSGRLGQLSELATFRAGNRRQGSALGVHGLGNIGQSAAVFLEPLVALK